MMIKIFTKNKNNKIELTEKELKDLLDEAYWDGYRANTETTYTYATPHRWYDPYVCTATSTGVTLSNNIVDTSNFTTTATLNNSQTTKEGDH